MIWCRNIYKYYVIDNLQCWENNPDVYGIRRSGRSRKEPDRLKAAESDSSERGRRKVVTKKSSQRQVIFIKQDCVQDGVAGFTGVRRMCCDL